MVPIRMGGVEAFLVIAAFFLTNKYFNVERKELSVGKAFLYRIKRIYPLYIFLVIAASIVYFFVSHSFTAEPLWYFLALQNYFCIFEGLGNDLNPIIGHFWYIGLDIWFFLLWVVILRLVPRKHLRKSFIISLCVGFLWRTIFILIKPDNPTLSYVIPVGHLDCWAIGGLVALSINKKENSKSIIWLDIIIGLTGIFLLTWYNSYLHDCSLSQSYQLYLKVKGFMLNPLTGNIYLFISLLSAGLLRYCLDTKKRHAFFSFPIFVTMGGISYELYCFHYPIQMIVKHFIHNDYLMIVSSLFLTIIVSFLWQKMANPIVKKYLY